MEQAPSQPHLKTPIIALMVAVAFFYDLLQILFSYIGLGWLIIPVAYGTFILWFRTYKKNFLSLKRAPTLAGGAILELFSAGIIPSITYTVLRVALDSKIKKIAGI